MGQAKRRGTFEDRLNQALERDRLIQTRLVVEQVHRDRILLAEPKPEPVARRGFLPLPLLAIMPMVAAATMSLPKRFRKLW